MLDLKILFVRLRSWYLRAGWQYRSAAKINSTVAIRLAGYAVKMVRKVRLSGNTSRWRAAAFRNQQGRSFERSSDPSPPGRTAEGTLHLARAEPEKFHIAATYNVVNGSPVPFVQTGLGCFLMSEDKLSVNPDGDISFCR